MARRGGSKILKRDAEDIATKLQAELSTGKHINAVVRHEGVPVVTFGIRHSRGGRHGHVPRALHLSQTQTVALARCGITRVDYFDILSAMGLLPDNQRP